MLNNLLKAHHTKARWALPLIAFFLIFQLVYFLSAKNIHHRHVSLSVTALEKRIALDLPWLQLPNDIMKSVADKGSVKAYLQRLNSQARESQLPVRIIALQGIEAEINESQGTTIDYRLDAPAQDFRLSLLALPYAISNSLSVLPLLAAILMTLALYQYQAARSRACIAENLPDEPEAEPPRLIINLHNRSFCNNTNNTQVQLSNKPFCFYIALVDYCLSNDAPALNHNKNVPDELLELANRYFYRLIDLGHTIRKRPDFSSNLDKMLSEIRAALDEVFADAPEQKMPFYPPKAQGEGSRSKLHNYALEQLQPADLEFIGK
ncbi:hypothetical protein [Lacimicrobium alkaliphilum]|uniref:Uncharacterized protein n=1 Tax=Lacimicrobium alkaliphilum TaxID=1526571 RepID=A0ABQ1QVX2_9ALTE|nr:hypothetical protein [Lacimicrobium alkaliphilum]GGD48885.1 hypothetical protein GCM10011357_01070 [Lacimicrobium alkaliphilum]